MLALPTRRQPSSTPSAFTTPQHLAAQHLFDQKLLNDYLESQQHNFGTPVVSAPDSFMTSAYDFANPAIRIQQSTPTPQLAQGGFSQSPMLATNASTAGLDAWNSYGQSLQTPSHIQNRGHQRASSSSSVGSSASQYQSVGPAAGYQPFSNHLPTPTHTPTQDSFMSGNNFTNFTPTSSTMDQNMAAHMSMKQALMEQGDDVPDFAHSARQSVSSYGHDSPATPHTATGDEMDFKIPTNGETLHKVDSWLFNQFCTYDDEPDMRQHANVPKFERTYTDIAADNFFDPSTVGASSVPQTKPTQSSLLSPYRSNANENVQRALQAAQYARSQSPTSSASRGDSPFRRGSPYRQPSSNFNSPMGASAAAAREQNRQADAAYAMKSQLRNSEDAQPKTISPKDALLDYREADEDLNKAPLFPDGGAGEYDASYNGGDQFRNAAQSTFEPSSVQTYRRDGWGNAQFSPSMGSLPQQSAGFNFAPPSVQGNIHSLPMGATSQYRPTQTTLSSAVDSTPEFPAHLTSMESSASEAEPPNGSQTSDLYMRKPTSSSADSGTYSCTYHGCAQRFETPQKLQKHKREGHRNANLSTAMTSAAILERNSQAGPHKCERINPTTGKPCNTIFSRPYDLTRHEDTIHNARKQKVRCALCVEEKTFSRNDALTRHMRVVHPEVDFPGKHRRRGGNHD